LGTLFLRSLYDFLFKNISHHGSFLLQSYKWDRDWDWVGSLCGAILWASLCDANNAVLCTTCRSAVLHPRLIHMGSSAQDGENEQYLSLFLFFWSFTVAKRFDFLKFRQLFWRDFVRWSLKILLFWSWEFFWIFKNFVFLPQNQVFRQSLTLSCDQTVRAGLDWTFS